MSGTPADGLAPAKITALLEAALQRLHVELTSPDVVPVGMPVTASIVGAQAELDVSDLLDGILDLGWVDYSSLASGDLTNDGKRVAELMQAVSPTAPSGSPTALTSTVSAGQLGRFVGLVGVPRLRVRVDIRWSLRDHSGRELVAGQDFLAPAGVASPNVSVLIPPIFQDLTQERMLRPPTKVDACPYYLSVHVTLSVGSVSVKVELPAPPPGAHHHPSPTGALEPPAGIPLFSLPLPIPTLVAMFSNPHFDPYSPRPGFVMVVVPHHSPLANLEHLNRTLQKIDQQVSDLRDLSSFAGSLLGIDVLGSALNGQPGIQFVRARPVASDEDYPPGFFANALEEINNNYTDELPQGVPYFEDVAFYQQAERVAWISYDSDSVDFDDAARSLVMLGLPGTQATFFNDYYYNVQQEPAWSLAIPAQLDVAHDPLSLLPFAIVPRLSELKRGLFDLPAALRPPETIPPNRAWVSGDPGNREGWGGQMGSMWFDNLGLAMGCSGIATPTGPAQPPTRLPDAP